MAILGSTAKPTPNTEWFGLNSTNQFADLLTLPAGGPWNITRLGTWLGGQGEAANYRLCLWSSGATLLRSSGTGTVGTAITSASLNITPYEVAGGTSVYVGFWRDPADNTQLPFASGGSHLHDTAGSAPATMSGFSSHSGTMGVWLEYEAAIPPPPPNRAPNAPTLTAPASAARVIDQTPGLYFTHSDPDGDALVSYDLQVGPNSAMTSLVVNQSSQTAGKDGNDVGRACPAILNRGTVYWWRARTRDADGAVGAWSGVRSFRVNALPTVPSRTPGGTQGQAVIWNLATDLRTWDQTAFYAKPRFSWTFDDDDGDAQNAYVVQIWGAASGGTPLYNSGYQYTSSKQHDAAWEGDFDTIYWWSLNVRDSYNEWSGEQTRFPFKLMWSQVIYDYAVPGGATSSSWQMTKTIGGSGQVGILYRTATGPGGTGTVSAWNTNIGALTPAAYLNVMVRLGSYVSGSSPYVDSMSFTYVAEAQQPDKWSVVSGPSTDFKLDPSVRRYGEKSLKCTVSTTTTDRAVAPWREVSGDDIRVTPNTDLVFSVYVKTLGTLQAGSYVALQVCEPGGSTIIANGHDLDNGWTVGSNPGINEGWQRLYLRFNSGEWDTLRFRITYVHTSGVVGDAFWLDGALLEASTVVSPWTPGLVSDASVIDNAGIQIDFSMGGIFRWRGTPPATGRLEAAGLVGAIVPLAPSVALLYGATWYKLNHTITLPADTETDVDSAFRVTWPGNPAMVGRFVVLHAWCDISAAFSTTGEGGVFLYANTPPLDGDGGTRLRWQRNRLPATASTQIAFHVSDVARFPADAPVEFRIRLRASLAGTVIVYNNATASYVSRIGYSLVGYV